MRRRVYFLTILVFLACSAAAVEARVDEDNFFSYKRFILNPNIVGNIPDDGKLQKDINRFAASFMDGMYAISDGQLKKAQKALLRARAIWPEYFGVDFLLARIYESEGNYALAARYYKSYLNKLKDLHDGKYRISGPLIEGLSVYGVEGYDLAHELVEGQLAGYSIDLDKVRPVFTPPTFLFPFMLIMAAGGIYLIVYYRLWPYMEKRQRINNPPKGYWICRYCNAANLELRNECEKCRRPRQ